MNQVTRDYVMMATAIGHPAVTQERRDIGETIQTDVEIRLRRVLIE
jgi:hypothetical protein